MWEGHRWAEWLTVTPGRCSLAVVICPLIRARRTTFVIAPWGGILYATCCVVPAADPTHTCHMRRANVPNGICLLLQCVILRGERHRGKQSEWYRIITV